VVKHGQEPSERPTFVGGRLELFPENRKTELQHKNEADRLSVSTEGFERSLDNEKDKLTSYAINDATHELTDSQ
jgi:hypothetical protein